MTKTYEPLLVYSRINSVSRSSAQVGRFFPSVVVPCCCIVNAFLAHLY